MSHGSMSGGSSKEATRGWRMQQHVTIRQHTSAYVSIRQHTSAYASIRQHTSAYDLEGNEMGGPEGLAYGDVW